jgi:small subunit ribosomal protein S20
VANIKSQIKRNKTNQKANERNRAVKSELKTVIRQAREAISAGDKDAGSNMPSRLQHASLTRQ